MMRAVQQPDAADRAGEVGARPLIRVLYGLAGTRGVSAERSTLASGLERTNGRDGPDHEPERA